MRARDPRLLVVVSATLLAAAVAFPLGVLASHRFSDVSASNTFHADIDAIADVGVTVGCTPTTYCPKEPVTREQMAAFLNRLGALGPGKTPVVNADKVDGLTSGQFLRSDVPYDGRETCIGALMTASNSVYPTSAYGSVQGYGSGTGTLFCPPWSLPDGATITGFSGRLIDSSNTGRLACSLDRYEKTTMFDWTTLGSFGSTDAYSGGQFFRNDTTISESVVDNETYAYVVECNITNGSSSIRILHLDVAYTVTGIGHP